MNRRLLLEVQVHAPNIRRGVRYLFLDRRHFWITGAAGALLAGFVAWGFSTVPGVARNELSRQQYRELERVRVQQGERLKSLLGRLEQLAAGAESLRLRTEKVYLAYGLPQEGARGQGGFPVVRPPVPRSIYADRIAHGGLLQSEVVEQLEVVSSFLRDVQEFERAHHDEVMLTPSICPLTGRDFVLTSPFGMRRNPFTKSATRRRTLDVGPYHHFHAASASVINQSPLLETRTSLAGAAVVPSTNRCRANRVLAITDSSAFRSTAGRQVEPERREGEHHQQRQHRLIDPSSIAVMTSRNSQPSVENRDRNM